MQHTVSSHTGHTLSRPTLTSFVKYVWKNKLFLTVHLDKTPPQMKQLNSEDLLQDFFKSRRILTSVTTEMPHPQTTEMNLLPKKTLIKFCFQTTTKIRHFPSPASRRAETTAFWGAVPHMCARFCVWIQYKEKHCGFFSPWINYLFSFLFLLPRK